MLGNIRQPNLEDGGDVGIRKTKKGSYGKGSMVEAGLYFMRIGNLTTIKPNLLLCACMPLNQC